jgi:hypothetical protein
MLLHAHDQQPCCNIAVADHCPCLSQLVGGGTVMVMPPMGVRLDRPPHFRMGQVIMDAKTASSLFLVVLLGKSGKCLLEA